MHQELETDNDIEGIAHLEIHHSTDEQFILAGGESNFLLQQSVKRENLISNLH